MAAKGLNSVLAYPIGSIEDCFQDTNWNGDPKVVSQSAIAKFPEINHLKRFSFIMHDEKRNSQINVPINTTAFCYWTGDEIIPWTNKINLQIPKLTFSLIMLLLFLNQNNLRIHH